VISSRDRRWTRSESLREEDLRSNSGTGQCHSLTKERLSAASLRDELAAALSNWDTNSRRGRLTFDARSITIKKT
jgi:hypothetical protein